MYKIYQIPNKTLEQISKDNPKFITSLFLGMNKITEQNFKTYYKKIWESEEDLMLEDIFKKFNVNHPESYKGRSLSCGDIVEIQDRKFHCAFNGWNELEY